MISRKKGKHELSTSLDFFVNTTASVFTQESKKKNEGKIERDSSQEIKDEVKELHFLCDAFFLISQP